MKPLITIFKFLLNILYLFHKCFPVRNQLTIISRQQNEPSLDIMLIKERMEKEYPDVKTVILCKTIGSGIFAKLQYGLHMAGTQMHNIAVSKVVLLDGYCVTASILHHRKNLVILQMWHAMGCLKKFGKSILNMKEGSTDEIADAMNMHNGYTHFFASSSESLSFFADAFGYEKEKGIIAPLPRLDFLKSNELKNRKKEEILQSRVQYKDKSVILYAPTFRKNQKNDITDPVMELMKYIDTEKYILVLTPHPVMNTCDYTNIEGFFIENEYQTIEMMAVCDAVITDYSAIMFETAAAGIPTYLYTYDYADYTDSRGFYIDFETDVDLPKYKSAEKLISDIVEVEYDISRLEKFEKRFIDECDDATGRITSFIYEKIKKGGDQ